MSFRQRLEEIRTGFEPAFWVANISELFERLSYYAAFASLIRYLNETLHFPVSVAGTLTGLFGGLVWFLAAFGGALADRLGFRRSLSLAYFILTCSYFLLGSLGAPWLAFVRGAVPLVALVDSAVIGHLPHAHQLAAVAVGASLYGLLVGSVGFLRMGTTGFTAQAAGREDGSALRQVLLQALLLGGGLALILGLLMRLFSAPILDLMQPSAQLDELARQYLHIRLLGLPGALASYALIGWLLGTQSARGPLLIMLGTNLLNVALTLLFVLGLDWEVAGAAWGSVLAEWSGALLGLYLARQAITRQAGRIHWPALRLWRSWRPLLAVNRDIFIRTLALQAAFFLVTVQGTRLGDATVAANALLINGLMLSAFALDGLAHAVEALGGHALGARDRQALRRSLLVAGA